MIRIVLVMLLLAPAPARAQGAEVAFGGLRADRDAPIEVTADRLAVDEAEGTAIYSGDVVIAQGGMRLAAAEVRVIYAEAAGRIDRFEASGGVTLASGEDAAEAQNARYDIDAGIVTMTGGVLLARSTGTLSADRIVIDLDAGTADLEGRVRSVLDPAEGQQ